MKTQISRRARRELFIRADFHYAIFNNKKYMEEIRKARLSIFQNISGTVLIFNYISEPEMA